MFGQNHIKTPKFVNFFGNLAQSIIDKDLHFSFADFLLDWQSVQVKVAIKKRWEKLNLKFVLVVNQSGNSTTIFSKIGHKWAAMGRTPIQQTTKEYDIWVLSK